MLSRASLSPLDQFPAEIFERIFYYCDEATLARVLHVCRLWRAIAQACGLLWWRCMNKQQDRTPSTQELAEAYHRWVERRTALTKQWHLLQQSLAYEKTLSSLVSKSMDWNYVATQMKLEKQQSSESTIPDD